VTPGGGRSIRTGAATTCPGTLWRRIAVIASVRIELVISSARVLDANGETATSNAHDGDDNAAGALSGEDNADNGGDAMPGPSAARRASKTSTVVTTPATCSRSASKSTTRKAGFITPPSPTGLVHIGPPRTRAGAGIVPSPASLFLALFLSGPPCTRT
jgi:hypothetical protein